MIIEDLALEMFRAKDMSDLFTRASHHANICLIYTSQNYFSRAPLGREIPINMTHVVLFDMPGEMQSMGSLSKKFTRSSHILSDIFAYMDKADVRDWLVIANDNKNNGKDYILIDVHPFCKEKRFLKIRTAVFPRPSPINPAMKEIIPLFFVLDRP